MSAPVSTVTSLTDLAFAFLDVAKASLATTAGGTPERSYVAPEPVAFDCCPFLAVTVPRISEEITSPFSPPIATGHRVAYGRINLVTLKVVAVRCIEDNLDADYIEAVMSEVLEDGWALWNGIYDAIRDSRFKDQCSDVHFDGARSIRPQGGCVGWELLFRAELGGIPD